MSHKTVRERVKYERAAWSISGLAVSKGNRNSQGKPKCLPREGPTGPFSFAVAVSFPSEEKHRQFGPPMKQISNSAHLVLQPAA